MKDSTYHITVDYQRSLTEMIASGHYDDKHENINEKNFPVQGTGRVKQEVFLIHFNCAMASGLVPRELDQIGYRPATLVELLAFGQKYPELQRKFPIIAIGSIWRSPEGNPNVPCLDEADGERFLALTWNLGEWFPDCRFLAVKK
jgi:hypothetical protein